MDPMRGNDVRPRHDAHKPPSHLPRDEELNSGRRGEMLE